MPDTLFRLAYFSRNALQGDASQLQLQLAALLATARRINASHGVTGALLFSDGLFAQVLEGEHGAVERIFSSIERDSRHTGVTVLQRHAITQRSFATWSMAFGGIDGISVDPKLSSDGMCQVDDILATLAGQDLLAALRGVVHRDELARRDTAVP